MTIQVGAPGNAATQPQLDQIKVDLNIPAVDPSTVSVALGAASEPQRRVALLNTAQTSAGSTGVLALNPAKGLVTAQGVMMGAGAPLAKISSTSKRFGGISSAASGFIFGCTKVVPFSWYAVRARIFNVTASALTNVRANVGTKDVATGTWSQPSSLTDFTVNGSNLLTVPAATGTAPQALYGVLVTDWLAVPSVARTDGGTGCIVHYRLDTPASNTGGDNRYTNALLNNTTIATDGIACGYVGSGNITLPAVAFTQYTQTGAIELEFLTIDNPVSVLVCGDSTTQGFGYGAGLEHTSGWALSINAQKALNKKIEMINMGNGSTQSAIYTQNGLTAIASMLPTVAVLQVGSVNDPDAYSTSWLARTLKDAETWVRTCRQNGVIPALRTMNPRDTVTGVSETARLLQVNTVKAMAALWGVDVIDSSLALTNAGGGYTAGNSTDGVHCNATGYATERTVIDPFIAKFV